MPDLCWSSIVKSTFYIPIIMPNWVQRISAIWDILSAILIGHVYNLSLARLQVHVYEAYPCLRKPYPEAHKRPNVSSFALCTILKMNLEDMKKLETLHAAIVL